MKFGLLFPGQGAQDVGMGKDFAEASPAARALFEEADSILGWPLSKLCFEGPIEDLTATDIAQPAIYTCSLAALAAFEEQAGAKIQPIMTAGLSLGEYTAMAAAGAFSFADGLRLVRLRGSAMQAASDAMPSGMASVMGMEREVLESFCVAVSKDTGKICQVANLNSPGQIVVSGENAALDVLEATAKEAGARRVIRLQVAGAFHSEVMRPAATQLEAALESTDFQTPSCPVWQNATAKASTDPSVLKANLIAQLCAPVLWQDSFAAMANSAEGITFLEPAPGRVLGAMAKKIAPGSHVLSLKDQPALEALLQSNF
ncbi:MAG: ACP S-malonyltransferase [Planctomycetota bacterium]|nr:ACP S-malonyltransferase [Planctomycetota bacterium]MDA1114143.1 ACP S-malonyltransferase [Planctomycetota bacterium]